MGRGASTAGAVRCGRRVVLVLGALGLLVAFLATTAPAGASVAEDPAPPAPVEAESAPVLTGAIDVSVGRAHTCARHLDETLSCWGGSGGASEVPLGQPFGSISAGDGFTCGLLAGGAVRCWGWFPGDEAPDGAFSAVSAGEHHACGLLVDRSIDCWGYDPFGEASPPPGEFRAVAAGTRNSCAIDLAGAITCWGANTLALPAPPTGDFVDVSLSDTEACAVDTDGELSCWGFAGTHASPSAPVRSVSIADGVDCAVGVDGHLVCWGTSDLAAAPVPSGTYRSVSVASNRACAIGIDQTLVCWGPPGATLTPPPTRANAAIDVGEGGTCGIRSDQSLWCLGSVASNLPSGPFWSVSVGFAHACGIRAGGSVACWGADDAGQTDAPTGAFREVSAGSLHSCGIRVDGTLTCWGDDYGPDCSNSVATTACTGDYPDPPWAIPEGVFNTLDANDAYTCGVRSDRSLACWGDPDVDDLFPLPSGEFKDVSADHSHACAIAVDGSASCWGLNRRGGEPPPVAFQSVWAASSDCGLTIEGQILCWDGADQVEAPLPGTFQSLATDDAGMCGIRLDAVLQCATGPTILGEPFDAGPPAGSGFHSVQPTRILDSRLPDVGFAGPVVAGMPRQLAVTGAGGPANVPATATAVVMNVTVTDSTAESFLTVFPDGSLMPFSSNLNFGPWQTVPNLVTVKLGDGGRVRVATAVGATNVVADLVGWYDDGAGPGDRFNGVTPVRLLDSRTSNGGWNGPLPAGAPRSVVVEAPGVAGGVPATASAVVANVTVTNGTDPSYLSLWPAGSSRPTASNLNFLPGQTVANLVVVGTGPDGAIDVANAVGSVNVIVDVVGYYDPTAGSRFHPLQPARFLDTRVAKGLAGPQHAGEVRSVALAGIPGTNVPGSATGIVANLTVADGTAETFVSMFPGDVDRPDPYSNLNAGAGQVVPNLAMVALGAGGDIALYNHQGDVALIGDLVGYFAPA